ncbi:hypothetical protein FHS15_000343 [Paenibacillus castaneae]|nr:hypothetical protein [Paenibacillus castaneae]
MKGLLEPHTGNELLSSNKGYLNVVQELKGMDQP